MPISFAPGGATYDVTPLENFFIEHYMAEATGEFVKVYIYGLMFCYRQYDQPQDFADIARDLRLNEDTVRAAFAYWEKLQLLTVVSQRPLAVEYVNLKHKFISQTNTAETQENKVFTELSDQVQALFSGERVLAGGELKRMFEWYEVFHFEQASIAPLVQYCIEKKGARVSFNYIDTLMADLAQKGITDAASVERWILSQEALDSGAARVLARWSLRRAPTVDEMLLYRKWTEEWGLTEDAVMAACTDMTKTSSPNFKYLDSIIERLYKEEGISSAEQIKESFVKHEELSDSCAEIAKALGMRMSASSSTQLTEMYDHFSSLGFTDSAMLIAARMLCMEGRNTLADLQALLNKWFEEGTFSDDSAKYNRDKLDEIDRAIKPWLNAWGQNRAPTAGERAAFLRFTDGWGMPRDMVEYAAQCASLAERPLAMMGTVLTGWRDKGIKDLASARADWERRRTAGNTSDGISSRGFENQRTYTPQQLEKMASGMFDLKDL